VYTLEQMTVYVLEEDDKFHHCTTQPSRGNEAVVAYCTNGPLLVSCGPVHCRLAARCEVAVGVAAVLKEDVDDVAVPLGCGLQQRRPVVRPAMHIRSRLLCEQRPHDARVSVSSCYRQGVMAFERAALIAGVEKVDRQLGRLVKQERHTVSVAGCRGADLQADEVFDIARTGIAIMV
jgi:hypothetical protein